MSKEKEKKYKIVIIGSGIGGLAAGAELKSKGIEDFIIIDKCKECPMNLSNGVHYLHSNNFGTPFPFELKEIVSTEEIWNPRTDEFKKLAHLPEMIDYSMKVMNMRHPSSIMDPGGRNWKTYLPLSNNMNDLLVAYKNYIGEDKFLFGHKLTNIDADNKEIDLIEEIECGHNCTSNCRREGCNCECGEYHGQNEIVVVEYEHLITTSPLSIMEKLTGVKIELEFKNQPLFITNYKTKNIVPNWLISLYVSDNRFPVYRITALNNILSFESLAKLTSSEEHIIKYHLERYFDYETETKQDYCWETGRIWGLNKTERDVVVKTFEDKHIHLLGRFGRWDGKLTMDTTILQAREIINKIIT